jgi:hypothetical protein
MKISGGVKISGGLKFHNPLQYLWDMEYWTKYGGTYITETYHWDMEA